MNKLLTTIILLCFSVAFGCQVKVQNPQAIFDQMLVLRCQLTEFTFEGQPRGFDFDPSHNLYRISLETNIVFAKSLIRENDPGIVFEDLEFEADLSQTIRLFKEKKRDREDFDFVASISDTNISFYAMEGVKRIDMGVNNINRVTGELTAREPLFGLVKGNCERLNFTDYRSYYNHRLQIYRQKLDSRKF